MKICVYGAGVIGGIIGSALARAGHEVSLIARGPHLDAIRRNGLTIVTPDERIVTRPPASDRASDFGPQDLVIVATKTTAFSEVAQGTGPLIGPDTLVAFAVNGVWWFYGDGFAPNGRTLDTSRLDPGGALHKSIGADRALGIVCWGGGEIREPGVVHASRTGGRFVVGATTPATTPRAKALVDGFGARDITFEFAENVRAPMWQKYFGIAGNFAMCALTGGTIAQVHGDPQTREVLHKLTGEALAVARAHGFADSVAQFEKSRTAAAASPHKPSMLQDLERGRPMEIDSTYGILRDLAQQAGLATPTLDIIAPLLTLRARLAGCLPA